MMPFVPVFDSSMEPALQFFFQSRPGMIFTIIALVLLAIFLYGGEIIRVGNLFLRGIFAPVINEEKHTSRVLTRQMEATEKKMDVTEQALKQFATAISEYAQHLSSHTSAIQGLAEASHELKKGAAAQNRILIDLLRNVEEHRLGNEALAPTMRVDITPLEKPAPTAGKPKWERVPPSYRALHQLKSAKPTPRAEKPAPEAKKTVFEAANLVEAMVLPYYRALQKLELEKPAPGVENPEPESEKSTAQAKKAVEAIMLPFYRTLYKREPENSFPIAEKTVPVAEKTDEDKAPPIRHAPTRPHTPWYSRRRHPLKPW
jgi:hypothetical protein